MKEESAVIQHRANFFGPHIEVNQRLRTEYSVQEYIKHKARANK